MGRARPRTDVGTGPAGEKPLVYFEDGRYAGLCQRIEGAAGISFGAAGRGGAGCLSGAGLRSGSAGDFPQCPEAFRCAWLREKRAEPGRAVVVSGAGWRGGSPTTGGQRREDARGLIGDAVGCAYGRTCRWHWPERWHRFRGDRRGGGRPGSRLDAFTVIADGDETDLPHARQVAQHLGLRHEVLRARGGIRRGAHAGRARDTSMNRSRIAPLLTSLELAQALGGRTR